MTDPADALRDLADAMNQDDSAKPIPQPTTRAARPPSRPDSPLGKPPASPQPANPRPESPIAISARNDEEDPAEASASALAELSGAASAVFTEPARAPSQRKQRRSKPDAGMMQFRAAAVPVLITVALIMTALGVWGILVKAGNTTLPMADQPEAPQYATLALVGLPLGLCLFAGAGFYFYLYQQDKKKLKAYEDANKPARRGS